MPRCFLENRQLKIKPTGNFSQYSYQKGVDACIEGVSKNPFRTSTTEWKAWWKGWYDTKGTDAKTQSDTEYWGCTETEWFEKHAGYTPWKLRTNERHNA